VPRVLRLLEQIARSVSFAHGVRPEPIVHRDLKPANILLSPPSPLLGEAGRGGEGEWMARVADFGIGGVVARRAIDQAAAHTTRGEFLTQALRGACTPLYASADFMEREFFDFYRTPRGAFTPKGSSPGLTTHPTFTSNVKFMNFYPFNDIETISPRPMLFITGTEAHSREFSEDAYKRAAEPKQLYWVPGAGHVDLYDRVSLIPWAKLTTFFNEHLRQRATAAAG
jgi:fermentation-respiration switch protein FrsA (DUF1100 family)